MKTKELLLPFIPFFVIIVSVIQYVWLNVTYETENQALYIGALIILNIGLSILIILPKQKTEKKYKDRERIGLISSIILVVLIPIIYLLSF
ncbi:hypothetical protein [Bacillus sp. FJAT-45066]|uniref:hypothetical protein n=1 Tax=Bacillus sp. FJAT-45066 TaxID=2011010 RepID=UPI000BB75D04|nr:hypothetical protein [Bacillus sp. FJAT-45066]